MKCSSSHSSVFLRDQQRWIDNAIILSLEGDLVTIRYETEEDEEISSWEEMVRLESIGSGKHETGFCVKTQYRNSRF